MNAGEWGAAQWCSWGGRRNINLLVRKLLSEMSRIPGIKEEKKNLLLLNIHSSQYYGQNLKLNLSTLQRKVWIQLCIWVKITHRETTSCIKCFRGSDFEFWELIPILLVLSIWKIKPVSLWNPVTTTCLSDSTTLREGQHNAFILLLCKQHLIVKENFYTT